ncbi:hypothetical protein QYM41_01260 [Kocuria sp. CPCC 205268]|uniref:hypothetical protein n=1 Tax=Kocuria oxytropis TaxID=3058913 RepID=UPI0034D65ABF
MDDSLGMEQAVRLHQALERASIPHRRLWVRYLGLGGSADELEVGAYLHRCLELPPRERDLLAWAANTLLDRRYHPRVPTSADLLRPASARERTA